MLKEKYIMETYRRKNMKRKKVLSLIVVTSIILSQLGISSILASDFMDENDIFSSEPSVKDEDEIVMFEEEDVSGNELLSDGMDIDNDFTDINVEEWSDHSEVATLGSSIEVPDYNVWLAGTIQNGLNINGTVYGNSMYQLCNNMQDPIYKQLGALVLNDVPLMSISSVWHDVIKHDFQNNQKAIYEVLIMDYLKYDNKADASEFNVEQINRVNSYLIKIFDELQEQCRKEGVSKTPEEILQMSEGQIIEKLKNLKKLKDIANVIDQVQDASETTKDLFESIANFNAIKDAKEEKIQIIKNARNACAGMASPNYDFISACDEIIRCLDQASFTGEYIINNVKSNVMGKILDKTWEKLCDQNYLLNVINWESGALDILFNTSDAASNNLQLALLYTMDCYLKMGLSNSSIAYLSNPTSDQALEFSGCFKGYVEFQIYGNSVAKKWIGDTLKGGALNKAFTALFYRENIQTAEDLTKLCESQNKIRKQIINIVAKYTDIYSSFYMNQDYKDAMHITTKPTTNIKPGDYFVSDGNISQNNMKLSKTTMTLYSGDKQILKVTGVSNNASIKWKSSNSQIAIVTKNGVVTAKKVGTCTISATVGKKILTCTLTVKKSYIKLSDTSLTLSVGKSEILKATVNGKITKVSWKSKNKNIATVNSSGKVIAKKVGQTEVYAESNGQTAVCTITVKQSAISAYRKLVQQYEKKYGKAHLYNYSQYKHFWTGLCFTKLLDFNGDGTKELILVYQTEKTKIINMKYHVELWTFDGKKAKKIVSGISWTGNNCPYFGGFEIIKQNGKYLLRLTDNAGWIEKYYGTKRDGTLGLVHSFIWKGDAMKGQWYYNKKEISNDEYLNYYYKFHQNSLGWYGFSNSKGDDEIRNEISKTKKTLKM